MLSERPKDRYWGKNRRHIIDVLMRYLLIYWNIYFNIIIMTCKIHLKFNYICVQLSCSVVSDCLWVHWLQHTRPLAHHQLLGVVQTHILCFGNAVQPFHSLSSTSPPAFNLSHHQGLSMSQFFTSGGQNSGYTKHWTQMESKNTDTFVKSTCITCSKDSVLDHL